VLGEPLPAALETSIEPYGASGQARLEVTALNPFAGAATASPFLNGYTLRANLVSPDGSVQEVILDQVAPGQYSASFTPTSTGAYLLRLTGQPPLDPANPDQPTGPALAETAGWVQSYSPEYRLDSDPDLLLRLVMAANGRIAGQDPAEFFAHTLPAPGTSRPVWPILLALAACLLPVDIAVRRLVLERSDIVRLGQRIQRLLPHFKPRPPVLTPQDTARLERTEALLQHKQRLPGSVDSSGAANRDASLLTGQPNVPTPHPVILPPLPPSDHASTGPAGADVVPAPPKPAQPTPPTEGQSTAAALLARKRQKKKE
jgi:hypothetical protein